ncbi:MAG: hypothetical protein GY941_15920 [Planctomycetes bacterium]|nr:hypothetical protein [Planctomycetota bacterium]
MKSKTVTAGAAQTVTLTGEVFTYVTIINLSVTNGEYVSVTTANGTAPTTAVVDADDTTPVLPGAMIPISLNGRTGDARVSLIAANGTPDICVIASTP